ncbi:MAG TPA: D-amino-acid transaminase [Bacilli bacterium]|nr:D-amino-acid transaminase [Bacilli bacterium]
MTVGYKVGFYNGQWMSPDEPAVPIEERGHQFGDGVYEVIRVYQGAPFLLQEHLERLAKSAAAIRLQPSLSPAELELIIRTGIKKSQLQEAEVYLQLTRGVAPRLHPFPDVETAVAMTVKPARRIAEETRTNGVAVTVMDDERWANCHIKSLNLLPNVLAKQAAIDNGFYEAVFVKDGQITEGSSSNLFAVKDGVLYTAPADRKILHGITRASLLDLAPELGVEVREEAFTADFLQGADEAFLTSTSMELMPVVRVDEQLIGAGKPGDVTLRLLAAYRKLYEQAEV